MVHWVFQIFQILTHLILKYQKLPLLITSPISPERPLCIENLSSASPEIQILSLAANADSCFTPSVGTTRFVFRKMSTKVWIIIVFLSDVTSIKYGVQCKIQLIQPAAQPHKEIYHAQQAVNMRCESAAMLHGNTRVFSALPSHYTWRWKSGSTEKLTQHSMTGCGQGTLKTQASLW